MLQSKELMHSVIFILFYLIYLFISKNIFHAI